MDDRDEQVGGTVTEDPPTTAEHRTTEQGQANTPVPQGDGDQGETTTNNDSDDNTSDR